MRSLLDMIVREASKLRLRSDALAAAAKALSDPERRIQCKWDGHQGAAFKACVAVKNCFTGLVLPHLLALAGDDVSLIFEGMPWPCLVLVGKILFV